MESPVKINIIETGIPSLKIEELKENPSPSRHS